MKKLIPLTLFLVTITFNSKALTYYGTIFLHTQSEIDFFALNYPLITNISGALVIGSQGWISSNNITNLNGLNGISNVSGYLEIDFCPSLINLDGLNSLTSVGYFINISYNQNLVTINGFNNLQTIGGTLSIQHNPALSSLAGLYNLISIAGALSISGNASLTSLQGLNNLSSTGNGGGFSTESLTIYDNPSLSSLTALSNLTSINGTLNIYHTALTTLSGLENLSPIGVGNKYITYNSQLSQCAIPAICASPYFVSIGANSTGCNTDAQVQTSCANLPTPLNLKLFLQGYYSSNGTMIHALMNQGINSNPNITDSVRVELHNTTSPYSMVRITNTILNTNGTATCSFSPSITGSYYVVVKHRNGIATWSASPVVVGTSPTFYDFTTASSKAYGNNMKQMEIGKWAFYSGDINNDENADLLDISVLENDINLFQFGYFSTDLNGDGNVDLLDSPILEDNINNFVFSNHP